METKREIHGLDQTVVLLMLALDRVFAHRVQNWRRARKGFEIILLESKVRDPRFDQHVKIHPVGLPPEDLVYCRFDKHGGIWIPYKGQFGSEHSVEEIRGLAFNATGASGDHSDVKDLIKPRSHEEKFKEILSRDLIYRCETS